MAHCSVCDIKFFTGHRPRSPNHGLIRHACPGRGMLPSPPGPLMVLLQITRICREVIAPSSAPCRSQTLSGPSPPLLGRGPSGLSFQRKGCDTHLPSGALPWRLLCVCWTIKQSRLNGFFFTDPNHLSLRRCHPGCSARRCHPGCSASVSSAPSSLCPPGSGMGPTGPSSHPLMDV